MTSMPAAALVNSGKSLTSFPDDFEVGMAVNGLQMEIRARGEIIKNDNFMSVFLQQLGGQMRADKAGASHD